MEKKVACVRFKEIAARFVDDANGKMLSKATISKDYWLLKGFGRHNCFPEINTG